MSERQLGPRRERYLLAAAGPSGVSDPGELLRRLGAADGVTVHRVVNSTGPDFPDVAVVEMEADRAAILAAHPMVHLEPDLPLHYSPATGPGTGSRLRD